ncbi:RNA polymerase sporulation sigma factor SigH [Hydrogenibacillus schlegelii]|uniref:RNA polymerase sigma-H factor n=1 Tax=Hydrogenibacillus schlegelii TaxID=1484 RepID=A0A179IS65_HYDSH|nr:RNA polymerase sporulation sigma factor SigH [Hydrogenibacillus schlegelii]OAR04550.1 RNA polymerase sigma-H factor [Hydrogenibacillus schlegelii]QZA33110.1 RNA polymerase sporulation sigma factor SigH [Hydrogenibacillus sp. N12]
MEDFAVERDEGRTDYEALSDEELVARIHAGDRKATDRLIERYRGFVRAKARPYFLVGADRDDIVQEGMIGLYKAIRDYRPDRATSFRSFADLCITRQMLSAVKMATRQKHIPLNSSISLDRPVRDEEAERTLLDVLGDGGHLDPARLLIRREDVAALEEKMSEILSDLEKRVLMLYLDGRSYEEIAADLGRHIKSIDNALQRVKRKLERLFRAERFPDQVNA